MLILIASIFVFEKADIGTVEKMQLSRDQEVNVIGQLLYLMNEHRLERIEELSDRFCFDCLVIRSKHADHCKKCGVCVNFRHKHSKLMGKCIGAENAQSYYGVLLGTFLVLSCFLLTLVTSYTTTINPPSFLLHFLDGAYNLYMHSLVLTVITFVLLFLWANLFDDLTSLTVAASRGLTLTQLRNIWTYKQCFDIKNAQAFDEADPEAAARINH